MKGVLVCLGAMVCLLSASAAVAEERADEPWKAVLEYFVGNWDVVAVSQGETSKSSRQAEWLFPGRSVVSKGTGGSRATCVIFAWDPLTKTLAEWGFSNAGAHWKIAWTIKPQGKHFSLTGDLTGFTPDGQEMKSRGISVQVRNQDRYVVDLPETKVGEGTAPARELIVTRKR